jgi:hypothetical protein
MTTETTNVKVMTARELAAQIRLRAATHTFAHQQAKRMVKHQIAAAGEKIWDYSARDLAIMATEYLAEHREELIPQARIWAEEFLAKKR